MIFIPGNVPSLKNSRVNGIFYSKSVLKYLRSLNIQDYSASKKTVKEYKAADRPNRLKEYVGDFFKDIQYPARIGFHFIRDSKRIFDYINIMQILLDLFTAHDYIKDDSCLYIVPEIFEMGGKWYSIDKNNPVVWVRKVNNV